jgi:hypothetical protein
VALSEAAKKRQFNCKFVLLASYHQLTAQEQFQRNEITDPAFPLHSLQSSAL